MSGTPKLKVYLEALSRESADYTKWRQTHFEDMSLEDLGIATKESGRMVRRERGLALA